MLSARLTCFVLGSRLIPAVVALAVVGHAQKPEARPDAQASPVVVLEGVVLEPDGSPSQDALVVSSAGARTRTDLAGHYRLAERLPFGATAVQVTASRAGVLRARTRVAPLGSSGVTGVGPLLLGSEPPCAPSWTTFGADTIVRGTLYSVASYDAGQGAQLYVGGSFSRADAPGGEDVCGLVRWNGTAWEGFGAGTCDGSTDVRALLVRDEGVGKVLYVGGGFTGVDGVPANKIAAYDGSGWTALGAGLDADVRCLADFDGGSGPVLVAGGLFTHAGGAPANRIAVWDGTSWASLGSGLDDQVKALAVYDDGSGPALYAGGLFGTAGGAAASRIAKWDGAAWSAVGSGLTGGYVIALAVFDDGSGPALYAGGTFLAAGGAPAAHVARWNGSSWSAVGSGLDGAVWTLRVHDDGSGPALYAGGVFTHAGATPVKHVARWRGASWQAVDIGTAEEVHAFATHDDGAGPVLYAAGGVLTYLARNHLAGWDGTRWSTLEDGFDSSVATLAVADMGNGPALIVGGGFTTAGHLASLDGIAAFDGTNWAPLGTGFQYGGVAALATLGSGPGAELYAGGGFTEALGAPASNVARWNGAGWSPLGSGTGPNASVAALLAHDDGSGVALYAGGSFAFVDGVEERGITRWNGSSWSAVGGGRDLGGIAFVIALAEFDDGSGLDLYAAGSLAEKRHLARWNGSTWTQLGTGLDDPVRALAVYDDGSGPALYAGGDFTDAGGVSAAHIARWDGASWSALGSGLNARVWALAVHDDGSGPALYAGGEFTLAGGVPANHIARWDGVDWTPLDDGASTTVRALAVYDDGHGPGLLVGMEKLHGQEGSYLARWRALDSEAPTLHVPAVVGAIDRPANGPGEFVSFTVSATDDVDPAPLVVCVPPSGSFFPHGTTLVTCTATDACGRQSVAQFPVTVTERVRQSQH